ncbi:hypothetical protein HZS_1344 [Henneguya salminicola]|nr:hypothetical protein HZS_1344 [Henneguya salminicola]
MNSIEAPMSPPLSLLPNNQPFFRRYWVGDIHEVQHKRIICAKNQSLSLSIKQSDILITDYR